MKTTFVFGFILGLAGLLAAAFFVPWNVHERVVSQTSVAINGGRAETFIIRLPADRIVTASGAGAGILDANSVPLVSMPPQLEAAAVAAEHFKVRNTGGTVIGYGARHWAVDGIGASSSWAVSIPSRGTIVLAADGDVPAQVLRALEAAGYRAGSDWRGDIEVELTGVGRVVAGTEEFRNPVGAYSEVWQLTGVDSRGELRGTITLATTVQTT